MTITNPRATFGLNAKVTPTKAGSNGTLQVGENNETINLTAATKIVSFDAVVAGAASDLVIDVSDMDNTGSTAWTAGAAQVETATVVAASGITGNGNAEVIVTGSGIAGSPVTVTVAVTTALTTATLVAGALRTAVAANPAISSYYTTGGTGATITLTRKASATYTVNGTSVPVYPANDATLNIATQNGTCTGITTAATSTNTTAGVATDGAYCPDLDGNDFEGEDIATLTAVHGIQIKVHADSPSYAIASLSGGFSGMNISEGNIALMGGNGYLDFGDITINAASSCLVTITIAGS